MATDRKELLHFNNMTVEEILNKILERHPGIWSYSECDLSGVEYYHINYDIVPVPILAGGGRVPHL